MPKYGKTDFEGNMGARVENEDNQSANFRKGHVPIGGADPKKVNWTGEEGINASWNSDNKSKSGGRA